MITLSPLSLSLSLFRMISADGVSYKPATAMCKRYQMHLTEAARIVGDEQVSW
jgi:hypothetical protein